VDGELDRAPAATGGFRFSPTNGCGGTVFGFTVTGPLTATIQAPWVEAHPSRLDA